MIPNLLNPVPVVLQKVDKVGSRQDHLRREPVNRVVRNVQHTLQAQVQWDPSGTTTMESTGLGEAQVGYIILRVIDINAAGYTPEIGDRLVKLGDQTTSVYVTDVKYHAHYADQGGFTLVKLLFGDRAQDA